MEEEEASMRISRMSTVVVIWWYPVHRRHPLELVDVRHHHHHHYLYYRRHHHHLHPANVNVYRKRSPPPLRPIPPVWAKMNQQQRLNCKWTIGHWCDPLITILSRISWHLEVAIRVAKIASKAPFVVCRFGDYHKIPSWEICPMD